jgi:hypothetical protein
LSFFVFAPKDKQDVLQLRIKLQLRLKLQVRVS